MPVQMTKFIFLLQLILFTVFLQGGAWAQDGIPADSKLPQAGNQDNGITASYDQLVGNWLDVKSGFVIQFYKTSDKQYHANLMEKLNTLDTPLIVLTVHHISENALKLDGNDAKGTIEGGKMQIEYKGEILQMEKIEASSSRLNAQPPHNAIVLFDGTNMNQWTRHAPKKWLVPDGPADNWKLLADGILEVVPGAGSIITKQQFGDCQLHIEFRLLGEKTNGGIYLM
jgi:hypothetical protein